MAATETARIEAFSDGVFAIAITLLVLDLKVPRELAEGRTLEQALLAQWPAYLAFVSSFMTILIMWVNHHRMFTLIGRSDDRLLFYNGLLLMGVTVVPFPTSLVAEYLRHDGQRTAALIYSATFIGIGDLFQPVVADGRRERPLAASARRPPSVQRIFDSYRLRSAGIRGGVRAGVRERDRQHRAESRPRGVFRAARSQESALSPFGPC